MIGEQIVVGLGGNIDNPFTTLSSALDELGELATGEILVSSIYRSEPLGLAEAATDFANAVAQFECDLEPMVLLRHLQVLEEKYGRKRRAGSAVDETHPSESSASVPSASEPRLYESRTLDLDIIAFGDRMIVESDLRVPHPRAFERLFVLLPLLEIDPGFRFADRIESLQQLVDQAPGMAIGKWQG